MALIGVSRKELASVSVTAIEAAAAAERLAANALNRCAGLEARIAELEKKLPNNPGTRIGTKGRKTKTVGRCGKLTSTEVIARIHNGDKRMDIAQDAGVTVYAVDTCYYRYRPQDGLDMRRHLKTAGRPNGEKAYWMRRTSIEKGRPVTWDTIASIVGFKNNSSVCTSAKKYATANDQPWPLPRHRVAKKRAATG